MSFIKSRAYALFNQRVPSKEFTPIGRRTESTSRAKSGSVDPNKSFDNWQSMNIPSPYETSTGKMSSLVSKEPPFRIEKRQSDVSSLKEDLLGDETLKDPTEEDLLELASRKICSYLDIVKHFEASASELVSKVSGVTSEIEDILKNFQEKKAALDNYTHQMERTVLKLGFTSKTRKNFLNTSLYSQNSPTKVSRGGIYDISPGHNQSEGSWFDIDSKYKDLSTQDVGTKNPDVENLNQMVSYLEKKNNLLLNRLQSASIRPKIEFSVGSAGLPRPPPIMARKTSQEPEHKRSGSAKLKIPLVEEDAGSPMRRKLEPLYKELKNMKNKVQYLESDKLNLMQENIKLRDELCKAFDDTKKQKTKFGNVRRELNTLQAERSKLKINLDRTANLYEGEKQMSAQLKSTIKANARPLPRGKSPVPLRQTQSNPDHQVIMDEFRDMLKTKYSGIYERLQQKESELDMIGDLLKEKLKGLDTTTLITEGKDETLHLPKSSRENENDPYLHSSNSLAELMNDMSQLKIVKQESEEKPQFDRSPRGAQGKNGEPRSPLKVYKGELNQTGDKKPAEFRRVVHKPKSMSKPKTPINIEVGRLSEERKSQGPPKAEFKNTLDLSGISGFKEGGNSSRELGSMSARDFTKNSFADEVREVTMLNELQKKYSQSQKNLHTQLEAYKNLEMEKLVLENQLDFHKKEASRIEAMYSEQIHFLNGVVEELKASIQVLSDRLHAYEQNESNQQEIKSAGEVSSVIETRLKANEKELEETKCELGKKIREIEALEKSLVIIKQELSQKEVHIQEVESNIKEDNKNKSVQDEQARELKMSEERLKVLMMENEILGNEIDDLRKANQELNDKKEKSAKELEKIKLHQKQVEEELNKKNKELAQQTVDLTADIEKFNQKIQNLSKELENKKAEVETAHKTLKDNSEENEKNRKLVYEQARELKEKFLTSLDDKDVKETSETDVEGLLRNLEIVCDKWVKKIYEERSHLANKDQSAKEILEKIEEKNKKDVEELRREINHFKSLLSEKEKELENSKETYENFEEIKRENAEKAKINQEALGELGKMVESLNKKLAERESKDQEKTKTHEEEITALSQEIDLLNIALAEKKKESEKSSKKFEEEVESLKKAQDQLHQNLTDKKEENESAKTKYAEDIEMLSIQIASLQQEVSSKQKELDENKNLSEAKVRNLEKEIASINETLSHKTSHFDEERKTYENKIQEHSQETDKVSEQLAIQQKESQEVIDNLKNEIELLKNNNSDNIKTKEEQISQFEVQIEGLKAEIELLNKKLNESEEQGLQDIKNYDEKLGLKEMELNELKEKLESTEKREKDNQATFDENLGKLQKDIDLLNHNIQEKDKLIRETKEKYQHELEKLQENINTLSKHLEDKENEAEKQKSSYENSIEKLKTEIGSLQKTIQEKISQNEHNEKLNKEEQEKLTKEIERLEHKIKQLEDEKEETHKANEHKLHDLTHQLEKTTKDLENKKKQSEQEVHSLKEEIHLLSESSTNLMQALETTKRELLLNLIFKLREIFGSDDNTEVKEDADIDWLRQEIESLVERSLTDLNNQREKSLEEKEDEIKELKLKCEETSKEQEEAHLEKENTLVQEIEELKKNFQDKEASYEDEIAKTSFRGLIETLNILNKALKIQEFVSEPSEIQSSDIDALNEKIDTLSTQIVTQFEEKDKLIEESHASLENLKIQNEEKVKLFEQDIERQCQQIQELNQNLVNQKQESERQIEETRRNELIGFAEKLASTFKHGGQSQNISSDVQSLKAEIEQILNQEVNEKQQKEVNLEAKSQEISTLNQKLESVLNDMKKKEDESERYQQAFLEKIKRLEQTILDNEKEHERLREKAVFEELDKVAQMFQAFISQLENQEVQKKEEEKPKTYDAEPLRKKIKGLCRSLILQVELNKEENSTAKGNEIQEMQKTLEGVILQSEEKEEGYLKEIEKLNKEISSLNQTVSDNLEKGKQEKTRALEDELNSFVLKLEQIITASQEVEESRSEGISKIDFLRNKIEVLLVLWASQAHEKEQEWTQKELHLTETYNALESKLKVVEEERDSLTNKNATLEQELSNIKTEHQQKASESSNKEKSSEDLRASLQEKITSLESELENYKKQIDDKENALKSLEEQFKASQVAKEEITKETDDLRQKLAKVEDELQENINKVQRVETFRETIVQTLEKVEQEKEHLVQELQTSVHEQITLRTDLDSKNQALQEVQEEIVKRVQEQEDQKKHLKEEYEKLLTERNLEFENLTKESLQIEKEFEDNIKLMREEITRELESKLKHVEDELADMTLSKDQIQSQLEDKEKTVKILEDKLDSVTKENELLNSQILEKAGTLAEITNRSQLVEMQEETISKFNESFTQSKNMHEESFQSKQREYEDEIKSHQEERQKLEEDLRKERELWENKEIESTETTKILENKIKELETHIKNITEHGEAESYQIAISDLKQKLDTLENICSSLLDDEQKSESWEARVANIEARISGLIEKEKELSDFGTDKEKQDSKAANLNQVIELQKLRISKLQEMLEDRLKMLHNDGLNEDISEFLTSNALEESFERTSERMSSRIQEEIEKNLTVEATFEYQGQLWCVISNQGDKGKDQRFFIKPQKDIENLFLAKDLTGKKLLKSDGLKEQFGAFLENLVQAAFNQTRTIFKGVQNITVRDVGERGYMIFKEILDSNEKLWTRIDEINALATKEEDFFKMPPNLLIMTSTAREENQKAAFLCSDLERTTGEGSPISLRLARLRSGRDDYGINLHEIRPSSVSGSVNRLDGSMMLENPMATFGELEDQLSQKELALKSYESKIDQLNTSHQKIADENNFMRKNMDNTIRVQGELRIANEKFKSQNSQLLDELKDRETDEQRFVLQIQILKKELEESRNKIAQMEGTHEKEHLKKILVKFMDGFMKGDQNKETPELLKIICSLVFCSENEKARLLDLLNKQLAQKNKGLLKMFG